MAHRGPIPVELNGETVEVDEEFVPVIKELNKLGLKTVYCCSGHPEDGNPKSHNAYIVVDMNAPGVFVALDKGLLNIHWTRSDSNARNS